MTITKKKLEILKNRDTLLMYGLMAPAILVVFIVSIVPLIYTLYLSFQEYILTNPDDAHFIGFNNFAKLLSDSVIRQSIGTTFYYTFASVFISISLGLVLAVVIDNISTGKTFLRIALFTPMMLSSIVVGVIWRFLFNNELGVLNYFVEVTGFERVNWLGTGNMAMTSIIIADVWQWTSYAFILILAALEALNQEPIEAATIDGANEWQIFRYLKIPAILPVIGVAALFRFIWAFRSFDLIYALTKGGPGNSTETMSLEVWRLAFSRYDIGTSSAVSTLMFLILILFSLIILRNSIKNN